MELNALSMSSRSTLVLASVLPNVNVSVSSVQFISIQLMFLCANVLWSLRSVVQLLRVPPSCSPFNGAGCLACAAKTCSALDPLWVRVAAFCVASRLHTSRIMHLYGMLCMQWGGGMVVRILTLRLICSCLKPCSHGLRSFCRESCDSLLCL